MTGTTGTPQNTRAMPYLFALITGIAVGVLACGPISLILALADASTVGVQTRLWLTGLLGGPAMSLIMAYLVNNEERMKRSIAQFTENAGGWTLWFLCPLIAGIVIGILATGPISLIAFIEDTNDNTVRMQTAMWLFGLLGGPALTLTGTFLVYLHER